MKIEIGDQSREIKVKEYQGQRVVTLRDVDEIHNRESGNARKRFNDNKKYFRLKEDYFVLNSDEASELGFIAPRGLVLLTESGYLMVVKSLTDDLSWEVQRMLVNTYFNSQSQVSNKQEDQLNNIDQFKFLHMMVDKVKEAYDTANLALEQSSVAQTKVVSLEDKVIDINYRVDNLDSVDVIGDTKQRLGAMVRKLAFQDGIKYAYAWNKFITSFNTAYNTNLKSRLTWHRNHGDKKITIPELLETLGWLDDGIRIADKLLNKPQSVAQ
jgi:hypothetical protein